MHHGMMVMQIQAWGSSGCSDVCTGPVSMFMLLAACLSRYETCHASWVHRGHQSNMHSLIVYSLMVANRCVGQVLDP